MLEAGVASGRAPSSLGQKYRCATQHAEPERRCEIPPREPAASLCFGLRRKIVGIGLKLTNFACHVPPIVCYFSPGWAASGGVEV